MATCSPTEPVPNTQALDALDIQDDDSIIRNQDEAEAILQPALSAVARHLTSQNTPTIEKALALDKSGGHLTSNTTFYPSAQFLKATADWPAVKLSSTFAVAIPAKTIPGQEFFKQSVRKRVGKCSKPSPKPIEVGRTRGIEEAPEGPALPNSANSFVTFYAHFLLLQLQRQGQHRQFKYPTPPPITSSSSQLIPYLANETKAFSASGPGVGSARGVSITP
ncbi:hypothetical protein NW759_005435 [Fusarium solani]|nr:hypothetical protein NW759_005435 [Fusarium solani]